MRKALKLMLIILIISLVVSMISFSSVSAAAYRVIGYVYGSPYGIQASKLTHINYAFASIQNGQVYVANTGDLAALVALKSQNPDLKVILSVGGWGAEGFSDAALTDSSRTSFANSCLAVINANRLDGIDLDWEYPVNGGWGMIKCRPEDKQNFTLLLQKIRNTIGSGKLLTIATGASQEYANNTELSQIAGICDFINIMTYDFGAYRHNANLYESSLFSSTGISGDLAVRIHRNNGVPASKINLGIPFYGRYGSQWPTYAELVASYINKNGWTRYWDATARTSYLQNSSGGFITYDDPETIGYKTSYIKANALGGAMFWQYAQDNNGELLNAVWNGLNGGSNTPTPTPTRAATPTPTSAAKVIPGQIEAENYNAMSGIDTEATGDTGGGLNVGWIDLNDWMDYNVNVQASGNYRIDYRVASTGSGGRVDFRIGGTTLASTAIPNTGGWQVWTTVSANVSLNAGSQTIRLFASGGGWNINWFLAAVIGATPTPTRTATATPTPPAGSGIVLTLNGNVLTWTDSASGNDYHVYKNSNWLAWTGNRTYTISGAVSGDTFYVTNGSGSVRSNTVIYGSTATATPTRAATATPTRVATATPTRTVTATPTPTRAATPTPSGYQAWAPNTYYAAGTIVTYGGLNYSCRQPHTSIVSWEPPNVPALWLQL